MGIKKSDAVDWHNNTVIKVYDETLQDMDEESWLTFMNHGYSPCNIELEESDLPWKHQASLYNHLLIRAQQNGMAEDISSASVLEVGCGRGGGLSFIKKYYSPIKAVGIDLNINQVNFCNRFLAKEGLEYQQGDACDLPLKDNSFDIIINVESSHLYANTKRFFSEVFRLLKPGGYFLFTDVFGAKEPLFESLIARENNVLPDLKIKHVEDMTKNVLEACQLDKDYFKARYNDEKFSFVSDISAEQAASYAAGKIKYLTVIAQKDK